MSHFSYFQEKCDVCMLSTTTAKFKNGVERKLKLDFKQISTELYLKQGWLLQNFYIKMSSLVPMENHNCQIINGVNISSRT